MKKVLSFKIDEDLLEKLDLYAINHRLNRSYVIRLAIVEFLERHEGEDVEKEAERVGSKWIVEGRKDGDLVYIKTTRHKKKVLEYLDECQSLQLDCTVRKGEFYKLRGDGDEVHYQRSG